MYLSTAGARGLAVLAAALVGAPALRAQDAVVTGTVRAEEDGSPVAGAEIVLDGRVVARSDAEGRFRFTASPGQYALEVRMIGFAPAAARLLVESGDELDLAVRLAPRTVALDTVVVEAPAPAPTPKLAEFYRRRETWPGGQFFEREQIERHTVRHLSEFFRTVRGVNVRCIDKWCTGHIVVASGARVLPSFTPADTAGCIPEYYLDGARFYLGPAGIDEINVDDIEAIEVYVGSAQVPVEFAGADARCGVVVMWSREGRRR